MVVNKSRKLYNGIGHRAWCVCVVVTVHGVSKELCVMDGNEGMAEQRAEQVEKRDDPVGVFRRHGRTAGHQLQQRNQRPAEHIQKRTF